VFKSAAAILVIGLAGCSAPRPHAAAPASQPSTQQPATSLPAPGIYRIDSSNSEVRLLVYRAGPLAGLGHNHVMVNRGISGSVQLAGALSSSSFSLKVPVGQFVVDDAQSRREEGSEFPGDVTEDAKSGTRRNMLGPALLDADEFPAVIVKSTAITGTQPSLVAVLTVGVAGHESRFSVPFMLEADSHRLRATGSVELRQTALGLVPYSLMLGALAVQDAMRLKFSIVAVIS